MDPLRIYVKAYREVLEVVKEDDVTWVTVVELFKQLREALSCSVCQNLLVVPYTKETKRCSHNICKSCKPDKPECEECISNKKTLYKENVLLRTVLQCYKNMCAFIWGKYSHLILNGSTEPKLVFASLLHEGRALPDVYTYLPKDPDSTSVASSSSSSQIPTSTAIVNLSRKRLDAYRKSKNNPDSTKTARSSSSSQMSSSSEPESETSLYPDSRSSSEPESETSLYPDSRSSSEPENETSLYDDALRDVKYLRVVLDKKQCEELMQKYNVQNNVRPNEKKDHYPPTRNLSGYVKKDVENVRVRNYCRCEVTSSELRRPNRRRKCPCFEAGISCNHCSFKGCRHRRKPGKKKGEVIISIGQYTGYVKRYVKKVKIQSSCQCGVTSSELDDLSCSGKKCPCFVTGIACCSKCSCKGCRNTKKQKKNVQYNVHPKEKKDNHPLTGRSKVEIRRCCQCKVTSSKPEDITCCDKKCPCFVTGKICYNCSCKGCRNLKKRKNVQINVHSKEKKNDHPSTGHIKKPVEKVKIRRCCQCGVASSELYNLTCSEKKCPCFVAKKACLNCACKGCRNPKKRENNAQSNARSNEKKGLLPQTGHLKKSVETAKSQRICQCEVNSSGLDDLTCRKKKCLCFNAGIACFKCASGGCINLKKQENDAQKNVCFKEKKSDQPPTRHLKNPVEKVRERRCCHCGVIYDLDCSGRKCPCFDSGKACFNCKCKDCRNPKKQKNLVQYSGCSKEKESDYSLTGHLEKCEVKVASSCECGVISSELDDLNCSGKSCPCFVGRKACFNCKCKGCRNPKKRCVVATEQNLSADAGLDSSDVPMEVIETPIIETIEKEDE